MPSAPRPARSAGPIRPPRGHLHRALGREVNPLIRPLDRARSRALLLAVLGIALAALCGAGAAFADFAAGRRQATVTAAHLHRVEAVVLTAARKSANAAIAGRTSYQADAAWTYPGDQRDTGTVGVSWNAAPGSTTGIWVGDGGRLAAAPPSTADLAGDAACLGVFTLGGLCVLIASGLGVRLNSLDRNADRQWQDSWARLEPVWSGRTRRGNHHG